MVVYTFDGDSFSTALISEFEVVGKAIFPKRKSVKPL